MHALQVTVLVLALLAVCTGEAAKKSKKVEKATSKSLKPAVKNDKENKTHKRGLYPEPHLGSTYALHGEVPANLPHDIPGEHLTVAHDQGLYGGVYGNHLEGHSPIVAATYAPAYGFDGHDAYTSYGHGYLGGFPGGLRGLEALLGGVKIEEGFIKVKTITKHVPVPVPHPVPVEVIKKVHVPVPHPVPVDVPRAVKVEVPQPYPVEVPRPYPVEVPKPVPHPVPHPVPVPVDKPYPVDVPVPYKVEVHKPVPVPVPQHIEIAKPVFLQRPHQTYTPSYAPTVTPSYAPAYSPTYAPSYAPKLPAYSHPVISVTKCEDDHSYLKSVPLSYPKEVFSVSSLSSPHSPAYDPHIYPTPIPSYHNPTTPSYTKTSSYSHPSASPHVAAYNSASPPLATYPSASPPLVAYPSASPPLEAYPSPSPHGTVYASAPAPYPSATPVVSYSSAAHGHGRVATSFVGFASHGNYQSQIHHSPSPYY